MYKYTKFVIHRYLKTTSHIYTNILNTSDNTKTLEMIKSSDWIKKGPLIERSLIPHSKTIN
jgi:hypothetical protein